MAEPLPLAGSLTHAHGFGPPNGPTIGRFSAFHGHPLPTKCTTDHILSIPLYIFLLNRSYLRIQLLFRALSISISIIYLSICVRSYFFLFLLLICIISLFCILFYFYTHPHIFRLYSRSFVSFYFLACSPSLSQYLYTY